jgi:hypothetical protein
MSATSFRSVFMVASCAGAALGCYLVSLRVASERAALEEVETRIVLAQRDLRVLETEIGTRGRLAQLERWNAKVLALSAPSADQFLGGSFELARLARPERQTDFEAPVVLASAPATKPEQPPIGAPASDEAGEPSGATPKALLREASLKTDLTDETREVPVKPVVAKPRPTVPNSTDKPVTAAKPAQKPSVDKPGLAAAQRPEQKAQKKTVDKALGGAGSPVTKPVRVAKADPLAPLPDKHAAKTLKDSASDR